MPDSSWAVGEGGFDGPAAVAARLPVFALARHIVVLTGAGMSAESGIATFRDDPQALWSHASPEDLATPQAWKKDAARVWAWYEWRRAKVMEAQPNAGHRALAEMAGKRQVTVVTQNVDDLHERAGSQGVIHVHGSLFAPRCDQCDRPGRFAADQAVDPRRPVGAIKPPTCGHCGGQIRPGVVWFTEPLPRSPWQAATQAVVSADLLLVVGTSAAVYPAAGFPGMALERSIPVLVINPLETEHAADPRATHWATTAAVGLPRLLQYLDRCAEGRE